MNDDVPLIPVGEAAQKYGISLKKLIGHVLRGELAKECSDVLCAMDDSVMRHTCRRGHTFYVSRIEWEAYKGNLPIPCPICTRHGLRS